MPNSILSAEIGADGWYVDITIAGLATGGSYEFGWSGRITGSFTSGTFIVGETATQAVSGATARIVSPTSSGSVLLVLESSITGTANSTGTWTGGTSGATFAPLSIAHPIQLLHIPSDGTPKLVMNVVSLSYDDATAPTTIARTIYGTKWFRTPFGTNIVAGSHTTGTFLEGEVVTQAVSGATGVVVIGASSGPRLYVSTIVGTPNNSGVWTGGTSAATFTPTAIPATYNTGPRERFDGTNTKIRIALSDYVFAKDIAGAGFVADVSSGTAPVVSILSGLYTASGTPNDASGAGFAVTNSSTIDYPKVVANSSWPGEGKITGPTFTRRCLAFHAFAQNGRPVRVVKFTATDTHSHTDTVYVTVPTIDAAIGDALPVVEYIATHSSASLTQADLITCNFIAYPWVGDSGSILDTSTGTAQPTPLYGPVTRLCDKAGTYGASYATVDPVNGNDGSGAVSTIAGGNGGSPYLTMSVAANGLKTYNNTNFGRNNRSGSTIYLRTGTNAWGGAAFTADATTPDTYLLITRHPSDARSGVIIGNQVTTKTLGVKIRIQDVAVTGQSATGNISAGAGSSLWLDLCEINCPTANQPPFYINTVWHVTRCLVTSLNQGLQPFGTTNASPGIIRGNTIISSLGQTFAYTVIGNSKTTASNEARIIDAFGGQTSPASSNTIVAYNKFTIAMVSSPVIILRGTGSGGIGAAVVQNVFENTAATTTPPLAQFAADNTTNTPVDNILIHGNVFVGGRTNIGYNEVDTASGGGLALRRGWSLKNNIFDEPNIKSDTFVGAGYVADATRRGNWALLYCVNCSGNIMTEAAGVGAGGSFCFEFPGLNSDQPATTGQPPSCTARAITYPGYVNRLSYNGTTAGAGNGDYRLQPTSPGVALPRDWILPFDLAGNARRSGDAAGAYTFSTDSGMFFLC